jgi:hypothetical protein
MNIEAFAFGMNMAMPTVAVTEPKRLPAGEIDFAPNHP